MKKTARFFWQLSRFFAFVLAFLAALYAFLPFATLKKIADSFASDGTLELFDTARYASTRPIALMFGLLLLAFFLLLTLLREKTLLGYENTFNALRRFPTLLLADRKIFWAKTKNYLAHDKDWLILLGLIFVGALFRIQLLDKPVYHDEAYTYLAFVKEGFWNVISDYHLPNNHVLYTIEVFFSTKLFGIAPWALRLPALFAGLLLIPATYFAARENFDSATALLASGIVALYPIFMRYGTSARGYTQVALLSMVLWFLGSLLLKHKNRYIWLLFILATAAGFYTLPIMVYPYTATMAWLFLRWLFKKYSPEYSRKEFFAFLFLSGIAVVLLFFLLYSPIFIRSGVQTVINNPVVQKQKEANLGLLQDAIHSRSVNTQTEWQTGMPTLFVQLSLFFVGFAFLYRVIVEREYTDFFWVSLLSFLGIIFLQHSVGWRRVWFFFAPVYFSFTAAGIVYLLKLIFKKKGIWMRTGVSAILLLVASLTFTWLQTPSMDIREMLGEPSSLERGLLYLQPRLTSADAIQTYAEYTPQMQYYAEYHGISLEQTRPANNQFTSLYVILFLPDTNLADTLHSGTRDRVDLKASELVYEDGDLRIYKIPIVIFYDE